LYQDKDYVAEAEYVEGLLRKHAPGAGSLLELGCGTGVNAEIMARKGYDICGVDISEEMLRYAEERQSRLSERAAGKLSFFRGDICDLHMAGRFDAVMALFHVASYQTTNQGLMAMFKTAAKHLESGGIFIFDFWYGPAVLTSLPVVRIKQFENDATKIIRTAEPVMNCNENTVDVKFRFVVTDKTTREKEEFNETHRMRYLFMPELEWMLGDVGFEIIESRKWMSNEPLGFDSWNGVCAAKKTG
jgi:SAM-dependent methyltransferase